MMCHWLAIRGLFVPSFEHFKPTNFRFFLRESRKIANFEAIVNHCQEFTVRRIPFPWSLLRDRPSRQEAPACLGWWRASGPSAPRRRSLPRLLGRVGPAIRRLAMLPSRMLAEVTRSYSTPKYLRFAVFLKF